jgi:hypothetical protein
MKHHTKNKGDLGVLKAQADLAQKEYCVLNPLTEHAPFDVVAYKGQAFKRIQVKYRTASKGVLQIRFKNFWVDRHGLHSVPLDKSQVDLFCVYCPDTDKCYYFDPKAFGKSLTLRIAPPKNGQKKNLKLAEDFRGIKE